ncbi:sarcosine oxidase subunit gamma [Novosphingobium endophyticum]|uniref:Sarcosine oxidase subunit gamma n=1 Tax=Novosphingobium endophyticum TaxID=1955250 RepID=A0A916X417_9SPHN|nr:sarcosine oxidase gamma subunit [Novosphingobium endophyticum]GGB88431.1 sarcosine oxidase subunit gamma [Novosphingobium endophyticum]
MADSLHRASPLPGGTVTLEGATLSAAPEMGRYSLRARDPAALAALIGRELPDAIGACSGGIARLGPDEFYALLPAQDALPSGEGGPVSIVDVSARAVGIVVEGAGAARAIMAGCPLDLDRMQPGRATRTVFEGVEILLVRETETRFQIDVWRSFASWLWRSLAGVNAA